MGPPLNASGPKAAADRLPSTQSDLATMDRKLEANKYDSLDDFIVDAKLIFSNCRLYNDPSLSCTFRFT